MADNPSIKEFFKDASLENILLMTRELAQRLGSDNPQLVMEGFAIFKEVFMHNKGDSLASINFRAIVQVTREMQEAFLEDNGALLVKQIKQMLVGSDETFLSKGIVLDSVSFNPLELAKLVGLELWSTAVIGLMCNSKRMAKIVLRLASVERIYGRFAASFHCATLFFGNPAAAGPLNCLALRALCDFSRVSKRFRALLRKDQQLFPGLLRLLSLETTDIGPLELLLGDNAPADTVGGFLGMLAADEACKDSHAWLIEQGFCQVVVKALSGAKSVDQASRVGCTQGIIVLWDDKATRRMLQDRGAARMLLPVLDKVQLAVPCQGLSSILKHMLSNPRAEWPQQLRHYLQVFREPLKSAIGLHTYCSWPKCDPDLMLRLPFKELKKCAACKSAFYCSKEHQKLHWPTHKKACNKFCSLLDEEVEE